MDKWTKAVARLIELTQKGTVKWTKTDPPDMSGTSSFSEIAYSTEYDGSYLRIFRKRFRNLGEYPDWGGSAALSTPRQRAEQALQAKGELWSEKPVLQIIDYGGKPLYEFPHTPALYDLLEAVEYRISGVGPLIDKLASEG